jgi:cysteinyl-tRNA synthetase
MQEVKKEGSRGKSKEVTELLDATKKKFQEYVNDNLNTAQALAAIHDMISKIYKIGVEGKLRREDAAAVIDTMQDFDRILGILQLKEKEPPIPKEEIEKLMAEREDARKKKDFNKADEIRKELREKGIILEDSPKGPKWKVI